MRRLKKIGMILKDNSGETMVEVLVAFALLSIIMLMFSQGLASTTKAEMIAKQNRDSADASMVKLQQKIASDAPYTPDEDIGVSEGTSISAGDGSVKPYSYTVYGNTYVVFVPVTT